MVRSSPVMVGRDLSMDLPGSKLLRAFFRGVRSSESLFSPSIFCSSASPPRLLLRFLRVGIDDDPVGFDATLASRVLVEMDCRVFFVVGFIMVT